MLLGSSINLNTSFSEKIDILISLEPDYRAIMFITLEDESDDALNYLATNLEILANELGISLLFSGVTFGSYDWTIEFTHESSKSAAYICSKLLDAISVEHIVNSGSFIICKKILFDAYSEISNDGVLRSYTFIKSKSFLKFNTFKKICDRNTLTEDIYFNISQFPLIAICYENDITKLFQKVLDLRLHNEDLIDDASTRIALKYDSIDGPDKDLIINKEINGYINIKVKKQIYLKDIIEYLEDKAKIVTERQGYYDIICIIKINSVYSMHNFIMNMRKVLNEKILHTSTYFEMRGI